MHPTCAHVTFRLLQLYMEERQAEAERAQRSSQIPHSGVLAGCASWLSEVLRRAGSRAALVRADRLRTGDQSISFADEGAIGA